MQVPSSRAIIAGTAWGLAQAFLLSTMTGIGLLFGNPSDPSPILARSIGEALIPLSGLAIGFVLANIPDGFSAAFVSQLISIPAYILALLFLPILNSSYIDTLGLIFLLMLNFLLAFASAAGGGVIAEWLDPVSMLSMDWRPIMIGFSLTAPIYALSIVTIVTDPVAGSVYVPLLIDWNMSLVLMLLFTGLAVFLCVLGIYRNRFLSSNYRGWLVVGSLATTILSVIFLNYQNIFYSDCVYNPYRPPCAEAQQLGFEFWLLVGTFLVPAVALLGFVLPKYWTGVVPGVEGRS